MRSPKTYVLTTLLLSAASVVWAGPIDARSGLMKRHYWCNGVDSEDICPPGESMVPIDQYACDHISAAGRLNDITAPVNGETHTDCGNTGSGSGNGNGNGNGNSTDTGAGHGSETHPTDDSPTSTSTTPPSSSTPPSRAEEKSQIEDKPEPGSNGTGHTIHLKCTKTGGDGDETDMDCTFTHVSE